MYLKIGMFWDIELHISDYGFTIWACFVSDNGKVESEFLYYFCFGRAQGSETCEQSLESGWNMWNCLQTRSGGTSLWRAPRWLATTRRRRGRTSTRTSPAARRTWRPSSGASRQSQVSYLAPNSFVHAADYHLQGGPSGFGPEIELQCISDNVKLLGIGNNTIPVPEIYTTR